MEIITLLKKRFLFSFLTLLFSLFGIAQSITYNTAGNATFTVPPGVTSLTVEAWGAGGRGASRSTTGEGGGGGGGAYVQSVISVTPGQNISLRVGAGSNNNNNDGGDTWFVNASTLLAKGGRTAANNQTSGANGGSAAASIGDIKYSGGDGADGISFLWFIYAGGGGSSAGPSGNGANGSGDNGGVAPAGGGNGGNGQTGNGNGSPGQTPGGGGGGARRTSGTRTGGNGANGRVIVSWTVASQEINIQGNSQNIADGDTTPTTADFTDFGSTDITLGSVTHTFTIQNTGDSNLTIGAITFSGAHPTNFTVTSAPASTVAGGSSTTFNVTFNPSAVGIRTAMISIANNDANENPYNFNLQGIGIIANGEINVQGNGNNIASGDNTPSTTDFTDFGSVHILNGTATSTFRIQNLSSATTPLSIGAITITGANASDFSVTTAPASSIPVNQFSDFVITFNPSATGVRNAMVSIQNDDANENPYTFAIRGNGAEPEIIVSGNGIVIAVGDATPNATDNTDFGSTNVTNGTIASTFVIRNSNAASLPLTIGAITITGANAGDFTVTTLPSSPVGINMTTTFVITFNPSATGVRNATVNIVNDDISENPFTFAIRGTGSNPEMNVVGNFISIEDNDNSPWVSDQTDFGSVSVDGGSTTVIYTIQNTGIGNLNIGAVTFTGSGASSFAVVTPPAAVLASGSSTQLIVKFQPTTVGVKNAVLYIANDDSNESPYNFSITGLGVRTYPDTDGDGVSDNIDIDDDNDGIIDIYEQSNCTSSSSSTVEYLFLNETFGAGTTKGHININIPGATCTYCYEDGVVGPNSGSCDMQNDWSLNDGEYTVTHKISGPSGDPGNLATWSHTNWTAQEDHTIGDTNGRMAVFNASYTPQVFYETTISGILPNVPITYTFWAMNIMSQTAYNGTILPNITVEFRDLSNNLLSTFNTGNLGRCNGSTTSNSCALSVWKEFTTSVNLGNVTAFTIRFRNNASGGSGNDLALDDISIKQSYCDWEGDLVANIFDLDSDNDGIPDIEEAGFKHLSGGKGFMDPADALWVDANGNGLHDDIDAMIAGGTYLNPDSDGDGVHNFLDLDSDNDSLFDVDEAGLLNGDGDVDCDGIGDGGDTDRDGFLNVFDNYVGYGTLVRPFATDTDSNSIPDYLQIDSNSDGIMDIAGGLFSALDANNNGIIDGNADADKDGILDSFDTDPTTFGSPRDLERKLYIEFDGRNDYAEGSQLLSGLPEATIMGWIKLPSNYNAIGAAFGQEFFHVRVTAERLVRINANSINLHSSFALETDRWYHIAAVYKGNDPSQKLKLYVNGRQVSQSAGGTAALNATTSKFTIGKFATSATYFFNGGIDEVRVFNQALTTDQVQKMVYQEIDRNGTAIRGVIIPKDVESSTWASLLAYYRLDNYKDDVIDDFTTTAIDAGTSTSLARVYNAKTLRYQLAPMPFVTTQASALDLAVSQNNFVRGMDVFDNPWSILHMRHNMTLSSNLENLGLLIDPGINVILDNDNQLRNSWFLRLHGRIDLKGKSQLVQTLYSDLDPASSGFIERDQQGAVNPFNYNYWSSPVGAMNTTTNNNNYTVAGVMKDATDPDNITDITWTSGFTAPGTSPITLSGYWIYKFQNLSNAYANWTAVGPTGALLPGQGYTLKGSGALSESQNYTFIGKPFNGAITSTIAPNNINLAGNPYASALDANVFITDNAATTTGTLYFWEHFTTNDTHVYADYQGGYAIRNLVGGTPPVSPADISGLGSSSKTPGRFVPVGQGFFMVGSATGGTITFNNGQRAFIKEDNTQSNTVFRTATEQTPSAGNNAEDEVEPDGFPKIRLGFISENNFHRQILIGFMNEFATSGIDPGYDAIHIDAQPNDMCFINNGTLLNIQGESYFNANSIYPLQVKIANAGQVQFKLDGTENFDPEVPIYIHDNVTDIYHDLREGIMSITLPVGTTDDRFSLRFTSSALSVDDNELSNQMVVLFTQNDETLNIKNNLSDVTAHTVTLYNILGQRLAVFDTEDSDQSHIKIPVKDYSTGTYVVQLKTSNGTISKKFLIN